MTTGPILPVAATGRADLAALGPSLGVVLGPQAGQILRALVMARLEDGLIRLAVPGNPPVNVRAPSNIQPGMTVEVAAEADSASPDSPVQFVVRGQAPAVAETAEATPATPEAARAQVVAATSQAAAQRQSGLGPLMADLAQAASAADTPPAVKAAAAQVLAARQPTDRAPTSADIRQAVSRSGLFLETRLATQPPMGADPAAGDMKAALLAVRQVLKAWQAAAVAPPSEETETPPPAAAQAAPSPGQPVQNPATAARAPGPQNASPPPAPAQPAPPQPSAPQAAMLQPAPPRSVPPAIAAQPAAAEVSETHETPLAGQQTVLPQAIPAAMTAAAPPSRRADLVLTALEILSAAAQDAAPEAADPHAAPAPIPPPPYRGGPITAQPQAAATLPATAEPAVMAQRLLQETGGALARQELMQLASLPEAATDTRVAETPRAERTQRWVFEIPFAAPQGTAVAQFEISRDGRRKAQDDGKGGQPAEPVWRTRFSIDVEPMGPVHAQLALSGERVQVSLWAEREAGLARLRDQAPLLTQALNRAVAGPEGSAEVAVHPGAPHRPTAAAGRFVDVAS